MNSSVTMPVTELVTAPLAALPRTGFVDRWGGLPLLCWLAVVGMPLQRSLEVSRQLPIADIYASTLAITSAAGSMSSLPFVLFMGAVYLCAGLMVLGKPRTTFSILLRQWPLLLLILFVAVSVAWSPNRVKVTINIVHTLGALLITLAAALRYRNAPWLLPRHVGYVLGLNLLVHLASIFFLSSYSIEWEGRWRGLTAQANELGGIAVCAFWANSVTLICTKKDQYHLHFLLAACAVAAMLGANSMTSLISSMMTLVTIFVVNGTDRYRIEERLFIGVLGFILLLLAVGLLFLGNVREISSLLVLAGRSADLTGRTDIWMAAIDAISKSPWVGWGFDDNAYLIQTTGMPYGHYHNGYLDLMVRGGTIALGIFFLIVGHWLYQLTRRARLGSDIVAYAIPFVITMLIYNLTEVNLVAPRNLMWVIFLTILLLGGCKKYVRTANLDPRRFRMGLSSSSKIESSNFSLSEKNISSIIQFRRE